MKKILFVFLMLGSILSYACGNYYFAVDKDGNLVPLGYTWKYPVL
jgi:hypothetical protein